MSLTPDRTSGTRLYGFPINWFIYKERFLTVIFEMTREWLEKQETPPALLANSKTCPVCEGYGQVIEDTT